MKMCTKQSKQNMCSYIHYTFPPILCSWGESASRSPNSNMDLQILFTILSVFQKNNKEYDRSLSNRSVECLSGCAMFAQRNCIQDQGAENGGKGSLSPRNFWSNENTRVLTNERARSKFAS